MVIIGLERLGGDKMNEDTYCDLCEMHHNEGRCFKMIYVQCCSYCREVKAVWKFEPEEYYPVTHEWMEECYIGVHSSELLYDKSVDISYMGYCCVECEIEDKGWPY